LGVGAGCGKSSTPALMSPGRSVMVMSVTEGGQAVVAGDTVTRDPGERRRGMIEK
jgi:hypothetical protein